MKDKKLDVIVDLLLDGLMFDGGHHKQYYLEQALRKTMEFMGDNGQNFKKIKTTLQWEEGIPA